MKILHEVKKAQIIYSIFPKITYLLNLLFGGFYLFPGIFFVFFFFLNHCIWLIFISNLEEDVYFQ